MNLAGKAILVVGGAAGIGAATARLCAERGASVIVADRDEAAGAGVARDCRGAFILVDVADEASVKRMYARVAETLGRLNVLLHVAGVLKGAHVPLEEFTLDTFRMVLDVNTTGSFLSSKHAVPLLEKTGGGVIVLVSSGAATNGSSSFAYGTSKGGVNSLAVVLANALAPKNIRVNVVSPGNIDTGMKRSVIAAEVARSGRPTELERAVADAGLGSPPGVARVLAWLASDDADYVRGVVTTR
jgi:NAD(P)-dependent dehydrogenase (short-subunit alcohol dehydrogenase family)